MTIEETIKILQNISSSKIEDDSLLRIINKSIDVLNEVNLKDLTADQKSLIENELHDLFKVNNPKQADKKEMQKMYGQLIKFIKDKLFLIADDHYMGRGMAWGMILGTLALAYSIFFIESFFKFYFPIFGMMIGMVIGRVLDSEAKKQKWTLKIRMY